MSVKKWYCYKLRRGNYEYISSNNKGSERCLGFTQLYPSFSSVSMKRTWILNDLYVQEEARKQGIAQALLDKAKLHAIQSNAKSLELQTAPDNTNA
ncbi:GNAT family N-acetyltransferase [Paenibacillus sp. NPDC055715]